VKLAGVQPDDVVLEVGAADGLLTRPLLAEAAHVHAFEVDQRFAAPLEQLAARHGELTVHLRDALRADFGALQPSPTLLAANLAYNIAIPVLMKSLQELPGVRRWAVMVQRELGERLFACPSTKAYSAVSVRVQLACRRLASRPIPRTVFSPQPRVDSVFVVFERRDDAPDASSAAAVQRLVRVAFAQRRKMLANSLSGLQWPALDPQVAETVDRKGADGSGSAPATKAEGGTAPPQTASERSAARPAVQTGVLTPATVRAALAALDMNASARPEELAPEQLLALARELRPRPAARADA
jgi:16S rRNA (adenine1518-N6/adenine1519-N6)-dimethyltransferase